MVETMDGYEEYKQQQDEYRINTSLNSTKYWVFVQKEGKQIDIGYKDNEAAAYEMGYAEAGQYHFDVVPLNTTNIAEAHRRYKKILLQKNHNLDSATSLISRKPAEKRQKEDQSIFGSEMM